MDRSVTHASFTLERAYLAPPARVFAAWADPAVKARWFAGGTGEGDYQLDFRVGGREVASGYSGKLSMGIGGINSCVISRPWDPEYIGRHLVPRDGVWGREGSRGRSRERREDLFCV